MRNVGDVIEIFLSSAINLKLMFTEYSNTDVNNKPHTSSSMHLNFSSCTIGYQLESEANKKFQKKFTYMK